MGLAPGSWEVAVTWRFEGESISFRVYPEYLFTWPRQTIAYLAELYIAERAKLSARAIHG